MPAHGDFRRRRSKHCEHMTLSVCVDSEHYVFALAAAAEEKDAYTESHKKRTVAGLIVFSLDRCDRSREVAKLSPDLWDRSLEMTESNRSALLQTCDVVRHGEMCDERW